MNTEGGQKLNEQMAKIPTHELVYRQIREMILCGELEPGQAVTIQGLVSHLEAGMTPVREAIRRLTAESALVFQGNRRVSVPVLTLDELNELAFARLAIEPQLAFWATAKLTVEQIGLIERIDQDLNNAIARGDVRDYLYYNYRFHAQLYAVSGAEILVSIADSLWLRMGPSLRVICGRYGTTNLPDMHADALAAMKRGDAQGVMDAINADLEQGIDQVRASLLEATNGL